MTDTNQPVAKINDGAITATIWANETADGHTRYSVNFARSYKTDDGEWKESHSYSGAELLRVGRLAELAYDKIIELRRPAAEPEAPSP